MMDLPNPAFAFTIPSVYDGTELSCRLYLPNGFHRQSPPTQTLRGAIVAHPYAPLGGCADDPVVGFVGGELLQAGYVVGTFNFRYVRDSFLRALPSGGLGGLGTTVVGLHARECAKP